MLCTVRRKHTTPIDLWIKIHKKNSATTMTRRVIETPIHVVLRLMNVPEPGIPNS